MMLIDMIFILPMVCGACGFIMLVAFLADFIIDKIKNK